MNLKTPLTEDEVGGLKAGDKVELSGTVVTARDAAHKYLMEGGELPFELNVIYHCGPVVRDREIISAGPTTSIREEPYEAEVIEGFGVRAVIGKGGMGGKTLKALSDFGCVYFAAVGGAGAVVAESVKEVEDVFMLEEFGVPEAFWVLRVKDMPLTVAMDSHGRSLYADVERESSNNLKKIINNL